MAWDDEMVAILRDGLQDYGTPPIYADDRLATAILVSALLLQNEATFIARFEPSVPNGTLRPDPTKPPYRDVNFMSLVCLKAASALVVAELRDLTRGGISIRDGDNEMKLNRDPKSLELMVRTYQQKFDDAFYAFKIGGDTGLGDAIYGRDACPDRLWR